MFYDINKINSGIFKELLFYSLKNCKYIMLIVRKGLGISKNLEVLLSELNNYLFTREEVIEWPGTRIDDDLAFKYLYYWDRYLDPMIKKRSKQWCEKFNYAQAALKRIIEMK